MLRRFVDVIFVQPKQRYYVVLHQGQFWQLPRLNLNQNSWLLKKPYDGSLADIYVAKDQAVACKQLSDILQTFELPKQLHGSDAMRFLDWWNQYDYQWLSTQDLVNLKQSQTQAVNDRQTTVAQDTSSTNTANTLAHDKPKAKPNPKPNHQATAQLGAQQADSQPKTKNTQAKPQSQAMGVSSSPSTQPTNQTAAKPAQAKPTNADTTAQTSTAKAAAQASDEMDIFDSLLHDLTEEVLHSHD